LAGTGYLVDPCLWNIIIICDNKINNFCRLKCLWNYPGCRVRKSSSCLRNIVNNWKNNKIINIKHVMRMEYESSSINDVTLRGGPSTAPTVLFVFCVGPIGGRLWMTSRSEWGGGSEGVCRVVTSLRDLYCLFVT
jgi:hypothetical protein